MICATCTHSQDGHAGDNCPMVKAGVANTHRGGCNLPEVDLDRVAAEKARIEALPDLAVHQYRPDRSEKALQLACEGLLSARGYRRMSAPEAVASVKPDTETNGWFSHLHKTIGNPLMPDLMIYTSDMSRCLMVELKARHVFQPGQSEMIQFGAWQLAETFLEFVEILNRWEK